MQDSIKDENFDVIVSFYDFNAFDIESDIEIGKVVLHRKNSQNSEETISEKLIPLTPENLKTFCNQDDALSPRYLALALSLVSVCFVSASPGQIKVISGPRGQRVLHGKTGWKIPILERVDVMTASMISIDAKTTDYVPTNDYINVKVDAAVKVRIATDDKEKFQAATRNFLYKNTETIAEEVRDTIEGHLRAIIGQMKLRQIVTDRTSFSDKVQENAKQDLAEMGLASDAAILDALINIDNEFIQLAIVAQGRKKDLIALSDTPYKSVRDEIYHSGCILAIKELNKKRRFL